MVDMNLNYINDHWGYCTDFCPKEEQKSSGEEINRKFWFVTGTVLGSLTILILLTLLGLCLSGKLRCRYFKNETTNHVILTFRESCFKTHFCSRDVKEAKHLEMS